MRSLRVKTVLGHSLLALTVVASLVVISISSASTASAAASGPSFTVMNTSETPPDGVWFRNSPHTTDTSRITGLGVYMNERVQLQCYAWGDAVGKYNDRLWYNVNNLSRPTNNGAPNQGYLNAHYINDGKNANVVDAGVPACGAGTPTGTGSGSPGGSTGETPTGGAVYYSPYDATSHLPTDALGKVPPNVLLIPVGDWAGGKTCNPSKAFDKTPISVGGKIVSTLAGWSLGRLGPIYDLQFLELIRSPALARIKYVLLIDPGSGELGNSHSCDALAGPSLAKWLAAVPDAHLVVLSGPDTQAKNSAGIQNYYFNPIRNMDKMGNLRSRVLVCNYSDSSESIAASHQTIFSSARELIGRPPLTSCPGLDKMTFTGPWHP